MEAKGDQRTIVKLLILWLLISMYVILHEGGHALIAIFSGSEITYFSINLFNAHINYSGGEMTAFVKSIINIAGFALPYLLWLIFFILVPKKAGKIIEYFKVYSLAIIATILPWIVIPLLYLNGKAPVGDDTTKFLHNSSLLPWVVSLFFIFLLISSLLLWLKKTNNPKMIFMGKDTPLNIKIKKLSYLVIPALLFLVLMTFPWVNNLEAHVDEGYELLCHAELNEIEGSGWELCKFWIEEKEGTKKIGVLISAKNITADVWELKLEGNNGKKVSLIDYRGFKSDKMNLRKNLTLEPGEYKFMMNGQEIVGNLYIYLNEGNNL